MGYFYEKKIPRSPTIVLVTYLIKYHNMNLATAYSYLIDKRSCIHPNDGFLKQLNIFYKKINSKDELFTR